MGFLSKVAQALTSGGTNQRSTGYGQGIRCCQNCSQNDYCRCAQQGDPNTGTCICDCDCDGDCACQ